MPYPWSKVIEEYCHFCGNCICSEPSFLISWCRIYDLMAIYFCECCHSLLLIFFPVDRQLSRILLTAKHNFMTNTQLNKAKQTVWKANNAEGKRIISEISENLCPCNLQDLYVLNIGINSTPIGLHIDHFSQPKFR